MTPGLSPIGGLGSRRLRPSDPRAPSLPSSRVPSKGAQHAGDGQRCVLPVAAPFSLAAAKTGALPPMMSPRGHVTLASQIANDTPRSPVSDTPRSFAYTSRSMGTPRVAAMPASPTMSAPISGTSSDDDQEARPSSRGHKGSPNQRQQALNGRYGSISLEQAIESFHRSIRGDAAALCTATGIEARKRAEDLLGKPECDTLVAAGERVLMGWASGNAARTGAATARGSGEGTKADRGAKFPSVLQRLPQATTRRALTIACYAMLPEVQEAERLRAKVRELQAQQHASTRAYLEELVALRNRLRGDLTEKPEAYFSAEDRYYWDGIESLPSEHRDFVSSVLLEKLRCYASQHPSATFAELQTISRRAQQRAEGAESAADGMRAELEERRKAAVEAEKRSAVQAARIKELEKQLEVQFHTTVLEKNRAAQLHRADKRARQDERMRVKELEKELEDLHSELHQLRETQAELRNASQANLQEIVQAVVQGCTDSQTMHQQTPSELIAVTIPRFADRVTEVLQDPSVGHWLREVGRLINGGHAREIMEIESELVSAAVKARGLGGTSSRRESMAFSQSTRFSLVGRKRSIDGLQRKASVPGEIMEELEEARAKVAELQAEVQSAVEVMAGHEDAHSRVSRLEEELKTEREGRAEAEDGLAKEKKRNQIDSTYSEVIRDHLDAARNRMSELEEESAEQKGMLESESRLRVLAEETRDGAERRAEVLQRDLDTATDKVEHLSRVEDGLLRQLRDTEARFACTRGDLAAVQDQLKSANVELEVAHGRIRELEDRDRSRRPSRQNSPRWSQANLVTSPRSMSLRGSLRRSSTAVPMASVMAALQERFTVEARAQTEELPVVRETETLDSPPETPRKRQTKEAKLSDVLKAYEVRTAELEARKLDCNTLKQEIKSHVDHTSRLQTELDSVMQERTALKECSANLQASLHSLCEKWHNDGMPELALAVQSLLDPRAQSCGSEEADDEADVDVPLVRRAPPDSESAQEGDLPLQNVLGVSLMAESPTTPPPSIPTESPEPAPSRRANAQHAAASPKVERRALRPRPLLLLEEVVGTGHQTAQCSARQAPRPRPPAAAALRGPNNVATSVKAPPVSTCGMSPQASPCDAPVGPPAMLPSSRPRGGAAAKHRAAPAARRAAPPPAAKEASTPDDLEPADALGPPDHSTSGMVADDEAEAPKGSPGIALDEEQEDEKQDEALEGD